MIDNYKKDFDYRGSCMTDASGFFQLEIGATITGIVALGVAISAFSFERSYSHKKQLREWRMPIYHDLITSLAKVDEGIFELIITSTNYTKEMGSRVKPGSREIARATKKRNESSLAAVEKLLGLEKEIAGLRLKLLSVDTAELDSKIIEFLNTFTAIHQVVGDGQAFGIRNQSWISAIRKSTIEIIKVMRKQMKVSSANSPFLTPEDPYLSIEELSEAISSFNFPIHITTMQKKSLINGDTLEINGMYLAWFKVPGYSGRLAYSQSNQRIRTNSHKIHSRY